MALCGGRFPRSCKSLSSEGGLHRVECVRVKGARVRLFNGCFSRAYSLNRRL